MLQHAPTTLFSLVTCPRNRLLLFAFRGGGVSFVSFFSFACDTLPFLPASPLPFFRPGFFIADLERAGRGLLETQEFCRPTGLTLFLEAGKTLFYGEGRVWRREGGVFYQSGVSTKVFFSFGDLPLLVELSRAASKFQLFFVLVFLCQLPGAVDKVFFSGASSPSVRRSVCTPDLRHLWSQAESFSQEAK